MTLFPEIEDALVRAAHSRRQRAARWIRRSQRRAVILVLATTAMAGSAMAAGVLVSERKFVDSGPTGPKADASTGDYTVSATVRAQEAGLSIDLSQPGQRDGRPSTCTPQPIDHPLNINVTVIGGGNYRLVFGIASAQVQTVEATNVERQIVLRDLDGAPGQYFAVPAAKSGGVTLIARDRDGRELQRIDTATLGPIGRGDFTVGDR